MSRYIASTDSRRSAIPCISTKRSPPTSQSSQLEGVAFLERGRTRQQSCCKRERESWLMRFDLFSEGFYSSKLQNAFVNMATCVCQNGKIYSTEFLEEELGNRFVARESESWPMRLGPIPRKIDRYGSLVLFVTS